MLPIRFASLRLTIRFGVCTLLVFGMGSVLNPVRADKLPPLGVDEFRELIDRKRDPSPDATALTNYNRTLLKAAADLPSLAEVSRVLLLPEWSASELDTDTPAPSDVRRAVAKAVAEPKDEAFKDAVRKLLQTPPGEMTATSVTRTIVAKIKSEVRIQLVKRLEERLRFYLRDDRPVNRIAAANLIADTMMTSHRQDVSQFKGVIGVMHTTAADVTPSSRYLRNRLRELIGEVRKRTEDTDPQVQVAAIRALSNLENDGAALATFLEPLLTSAQSNVVARRAAAEALDHMLDVTTTQMDKSRPLPYLTSMEKVLSVAVLGLADDDAEVRHASLMACQRVATVLYDLVNDPLAPPERRLVFRNTLKAVDRALPAIDRVARDRVPSLRILACRVVETLVLAERKVRPLNEQPSPKPKPSKEGVKNNKGVALPSHRGGRRLAASGPSSWATARSQGQSVSRPLPSVPLGVAALPAVTLERPIPLSQEGQAASEVKPVAFQAAQLDDLPAPKSVAGGVEGIIETMIENLSDPDYRVRMSAVDVLENLGDRAESAIPSLVKAARDSNKFVRWGSARTLGRLKPRRPNEVVPGLMRLLNDGEDAGVRLAAAYALEQYGSDAKQAVPHLARVINRGDRDYILAILHTIQGIGTDAAPALPNVAWVLSDREQPTSVRVEAALTLGRFGALAEKQLPMLREIMVRDPDEAVRNAVSTAVLGIHRRMK